MPLQDGALSGTGMKLELRAEEGERLGGDVRAGFRVGQRDVGRAVGRLRGVVLDLLDGQFGRRRQLVGQRDRTDGGLHRVGRFGDVESLAQLVGTPRPGQIFGELLVLLRPEGFEFGPFAVAVVLQGFPLLPAELLKTVVPLRRNDFRCKGTTK